MSGVIRVWVNDRLVDAADAAVSAIDHGLTVGDGVFETCKIVRGDVFAPTRHRRRLDVSAAGLGLGPIDHAVLDAGIAAVLAVGEPIGFGRLRYTVTGGAGPLGSDRGDAPLTYIVTAAPSSPPDGPVAVTVVPWTRNERSAVAGLKTTSYAENVAALAYAHRHGGAEAIFANTRDELCEGTGSNVFVVVGDEVLTPPLDSGCLAGVTRELTIQWGRAAGLTVREETLPLGVLDSCDEAFLTSSTRDVLAIARIGGRALPAPGPVTAAVARAFAAGASDGMDP